MGNKRRLGAQGETAVCAYLENIGYVIVKRNYRFHKCGEVDIIAILNGELHIIEVKTRSSLYFGTPAQAVDADKRRRIRRITQSFLWENEEYSSHIIRFDIAEVYNADGDFRIEMIYDAF